MVAFKFGCKILFKTLGDNMRNIVTGYKLTEAQEQYCKHKRYNFLILFPDDTYKGTWTRTSCTTIINRWNKKHPCQKICSLYDVIPIQYITLNKKQSMIKTVILYLIGSY